MNKKWWNTLVRAILIWLVLSQGGYAQEKLVISTGPEGNFLVRLSVPVLREAYHRLGITLEMKHYPWARALRYASDGETDGELFRATVDHDTYPNLVKLNVPITYTEFVVLTKDVEFQVTGWEGLRPYTLGSTIGVKVIEQHTQGMQIERVVTLQQALMKLENGRTELVIADRLSVIKALKELGFTDIRILEPPLERMPLYHYLHTRHAALIPQLEQTLTDMEQEGVIQSIQEQVLQKILASPSE